MYTPHRYGLEGRAVTRNGRRPRVVRQGVGQLAVRRSWADEDAGL